ncbi:unnamed protein product [Pieris macdunnoughi]|uniref:Uncharacterized protein n=1 Tax=Pieris macdunnoughi TaxID=345717 RepID=A0A821YD57_9NEOP|nr:unnamed protein product [Pieris macdunnoughi]
MFVFREGARILVGAPEDEPYQVNGVKRPGAVYRCEPTSRAFASEDLANPLERCRLMEFDKNRINYIVYTTLALVTYRMLPLPSC